MNSLDVISFDYDGWVVTVIGKRILGCNPNETIWNYMRAVLFWGCDIRDDINNYIHDYSEIIIDTKDIIHIDINELLNLFF